MLNIEIVEPVRNITIEFDRIAKAIEIVFENHEVFISDIGFIIVSLEDGKIDLDEAIEVAKRLSKYKDLFEEIIE